MVTDLLLLIGIVLVLAMTVARLERRGLDRPEALRQMTRAYAERMHGNEPVHTWDLPA